MIFKVIIVSRQRTTKALITYMTKHVFSRCGSISVYVFAVCPVRAHYGKNKNILFYCLVEHILDCFGYTVLLKGPLEGLGSVAFLTDYFHILDAFLAISLLPKDPLFKICLFDLHSYSRPLFGHKIKL